MQRWPCQQRFVDDTVLAFQAGHRVVITTSPTGTGKSVAMGDLIEHYAKKGFCAVLYTNRRILIDQLSASLTRAGIDHGIRAAGHENRREVPVQVSSLPSENSKQLKGGEYGAWTLHGFGRPCLVVLDEAHVNSGPTARELIKRHRAAGHLILLVTATPIGLGFLADHLVVAGRMADGRACGALVPARHFGCDEPDRRHFRNFERADDFSPAEQRKAYPKTAALFGRVGSEFDRLNPDRDPTILFACGVDESLWFAEKFCDRGVPAAHIDGDDIWLDGKFYKSDREARKQLWAMHRDRKVAVICNRFVMREGVDLPWIQHLILATVVGSLQTYIQMVGRGLRAYPELGKTHCVIQDHGGNWWRHGSVNVDRDWQLADTAASVSGVRRDRLRWRSCGACGRRQNSGDVCEDCDTPIEREPYLCPQCSKVLSGRQCECGWVRPPNHAKARPVLMSDGRLVRMRGDVFRMQRVDRRANALADWIKLYHACRKKKGGETTFAQARALYAREHDWAWPDPAWPYMPKHPMDMYSRIQAVDPKDLIRQREAVKS